MEVDPCCQDNGKELDLEADHLNQVKVLQLVYKLGLSTALDLKPNHEAIHNGRRRLSANSMII